MDNLSFVFTVFSLENQPISSSLLAQTVYRKKLNEEMALVL